MITLRNSKRRPLLKIDIDGVLTSHCNLIDAMNTLLARKLRLEDCKNYHFHENYRISMEDVESALSGINSFFSYEEFQPAPGAVDAIETLGLFFEIEAATARRDQYQSATCSWIRRLFGDMTIGHAVGAGNYHGRAGGQSKIDICLEQSAFALIEDNPYELDELVVQAPNVRAVCLALPYNTYLSNNPLVFRGDWPAITQYLISEYSRAGY